MFERYTEKARRSIFFARYEASQLGSRYIRTEHLLLGILRESHGLRKILRVDMVELGKRLRREVIGAKVSTSVDLPLDDDCKRAVAHAAKEAEEMKDKHIGTEHLLLGIMREERGVAAQVLREMGAPSVDEVRKTISDTPPQEREPLPMDRGMPRTVSVRFVDMDTGKELSAWTRFHGAPRMGEAVSFAGEGSRERYRVLDVCWNFADKNGMGELLVQEIEVRIRKEAVREA